MALPDRSRLAAGLLLLFAFSAWSLTGLANGALVYAELKGIYQVDTSRDAISILVMQVIVFSAISAMLYVTNRLIRESFARARRENEERRAAEAEAKCGDRCESKDTARNATEGVVSISNSAVRENGTAGHLPQSLPANGTGDYRRLRRFRPLE